MGPCPAGVTNVDLRSPTLNGLMDVQPSDDAVQTRRRSGGIEQSGTLTLDHHDPKAITALYLGNASGYLL